MVYEWKIKGLFKTDANTAGAVCEELTNTIGLTNKNLVEVSRAEDAPLHNEFEWRDDVAAERYRETQAAKIISSLTIRIEEVNHEPVRAWFPIAEKTYEDVRTIITSPMKTNALLDTALKELKAFQFKYSMLQELSAVFRAIDELQKGA